MAKTKTEEPDRSGWREIAGILVGTVGLMLLLGVLSYNPADIGVFRNVTGSHNWIGPFGARSAYIAFMYFGVAGYVIPFCVLWIGISSVFWSAHKIYPRLLWLVLVLFCLAGLVDMNEQVWHGTVERLNIGTPGGLMG
ncbi:MAG: DNA translocase FtsK 4TM domain-containing protein, partial [Pontiella sp.]|nr:DNA translocase FtsK 4TM domain-containing protein [Pontiella sp.]